MIAQSAYIQSVIATVLVWVGWIKVWFKFYNNFQTQVFKYGFKNFQIFFISSLTSLESPLFPIQCSGYILFRTCYNALRGFCHSFSLCRDVENVREPKLWCWFGKKAHSRLTKTSLTKVSNLKFFFAPNPKMGHRKLLDSNNTVRM
jgi:hypothetical protein